MPFYAVRWDLIIPKVLEKAKQRTPPVDWFSPKVDRNQFRSGWFWVTLAKYCLPYTNKYTNIFLKVVRSYLGHPKTRISVKPWSTINTGRSTKKCHVIKASRNHVIKIYSSDTTKILNNKCSYTKWYDS